GREVAEEGDSVEGALRDEMAAKLRARGCPAKDAPKYVEALLEVFRAKDRAIVEEVAGEEGAAGTQGNVLARAEAREALRMMAIEQYQAPKPRLSAGCLIRALGFEHPDFASDRDLAERQAVSPEHVSNLVGDWQRRLKLPPTSGQKTAAQKEIYKGTNGRSGRAKL
ncbi:MAG TPA: hypothetical protein VGE76_12080, partial [Opitutaceae bacterium]